MANENKSITDDIERITATLQVAKQQAKELEKAVEEMERKIVLARGTGDVTEQAQAATDEVAEEVNGSEVQEVAQGTPRSTPVVRARQSTRLSVRDRVELALRRESMNTVQLAKEVNESISRVHDVLKALKAERKLYNLGSAEYPVWTIRIGDHTPTPELNRHVRRLVMERPMTLREIVDATGARLTRVSGAIVHLQRTEPQFLNLGTARVARWFLISDKVKVSGLEPKGRPIRD